MNNDKLREDILKEARRIGDNLLAIAQKDDNGTYWETMTMDMDQNIGWQVSEGITVEFQELRSSCWNCISAPVIPNTWQRLKTVCAGSRHIAKRTRASTLLFLPVEWEYPIRC